LFHFIQVHSPVFRFIAVKFAVKQIRFSVYLDALYERIEWIWLSTFAKSITLFYGQKSYHYVSLRY
jgi:hypothetical protein